MEMLLYANRAFADDLNANQNDTVKKNLCKTFVKRPLSKRPKTWVLRLIIIKFRSKVLQNAPRGAFCKTFDLH